MNGDPEVGKEDDDSNRVVGMAQVIPSDSNSALTQDDLDSLNVAQACPENKKSLDDMGGTDGLAKRLGLNLKTGLTAQQVTANRERYGSNEFPEKPMKSFLMLFIESFNDQVLIILIVAAIISLVIGYIEDVQKYGAPDKGWIEGCAILIAVLIVAVVTASNDYSKEKQFRDLEKSSEDEDRCSVLRDGEIHRINPRLLVVGDVVSLKSGDGVPADGVLFEGSGVKCNESALTGEPDDLKKDFANDPFFLSSCEVTDTGTSGDAKVICIGIGKDSQWGKIKANLSQDAENTPLQDKLDDMVQLIGYVGAGSAFATFLAMVIIPLTSEGEHELFHVIGDAFLLAVTIIVVAIPEGLPLAVTISLAYSTKQMLADNNLIRRLQACETMGNASNICTDKTGTLTENRMTVVEGYFGGEHIDQDAFEKLTAPSAVQKDLFVLNACINSNTFLLDKDEEGNVLHRPKVVGSATEGALILLSRKWGVDYEAVRTANFLGTRDMQFPFNSTKKRSTVILTDYQGGVKLLCKGASEVVLADCTHTVDKNGKTVEIDDAMRKELLGMIDQMAGRALRTLAIAHRDFDNVNALPDDYKVDPPDSSNLVLDTIVGIIDPLRSDVKDAVATAQGAGVMVRMVTGDNIITATAIARKCGVLTGSGETLTKEKYDALKSQPGALDELLPKVMAIEGPVFRNLTPKQADMVLTRVQVMARSSPDDKYLMVTRLNGHGLPEGKAEWEMLHPGRDYDKQKDELLPGYKSEWAESRPNGGHVVGVTGDGTNDAPALKASDVGLAMGITGTQVAKNASDIVIMDDKFSSIVRAILWGRTVYDNIRRFLQFQLTVNVVALALTFISAVAGFSPPLNAVMMLWVNLIMDTMGALALGTEKPTPELLDRLPYFRNAPLVSKPMWRNILFQSAYQLILLLVLVFIGDEIFGVNDLSFCKNWKVSSSSKSFEFPDTSDFRLDTEVLFNCPDDATLSSCTFHTGENDQCCVYGDLKKTNGTCGAFKSVCGEVGMDGYGDRTNGDCYEQFFHEDSENAVSKFDIKCFDACDKTSLDYTLATLIFNAFVWCQIFNEFNARSIKNDMNIFKNISQSKMFLLVIIVTIALQVFIVGAGGDFTRTKMITVNQWFVTMVMGLGSFPVGILMRLFPFAREEDAADFFGYKMPE